MDDYALRVFLAEIQRQCLFALVADAEMEADFISGSGEKLWYSVQAYLIAVANVSKLLWPSRAKSKQRGKLLRKLLDVENSSALASRAIRNHFEHFDERLDDWVQSEESRGIVDSNITPEEWLRQIPGLENGVMRHYDPETKVLRFKRERYDLEQVTDEVRVLYQAAADAYHQSFFGK